MCVCVCVYVLLGQETGCLRQTRGKNQGCPRLLSGWVILMPFFFSFLMRNRRGKGGRPDVLFTSIAITFLHIVIVGWVVGTSPLISSEQLLLSRYTGGSGFTRVWVSFY